MSADGMRFQKIGNAEIDPINPWAEDVLDRRRVFEYLYDLLSKSESPQVFAIDSDWGTGKTFFLQRFAMSIQDKHPTVFFNAWQNDFSEDAFFSFYSEIYGQLSNDARYKQGSKKKLAEFAKMGGKIILKAVPLAVKGGLKYALGDDGVEALKDIASPDSEKEIISQIGKFTQKAIDEHLARKKTIGEFQETLSLAIDDLIAANPGLNKPFFVFIEELDRCRPTYAVKLLESIKHLFSTKDTLFILGVDKAQISHSIRTLYGAGMDSHAYLARFIDQTYKLPKPRYREFAEMLFRKMPVSGIDFTNYGIAIHNESEFLDAQGRFAAANRVSLREFEQAFARVRAALITNTQKIHLFFLIFLTYANIKNQSDFEKLRDNRLSFSTFFNNIQKQLDLAMLQPNDLKILSLYFEALQDITNFGRAFNELNSRTNFEMGEYLEMGWRAIILREHEYIRKHASFVDMASPLN
jgi:hypothetical protein